VRGDERTPEISHRRKLSSPLSAFLISLKDGSSAFVTLGPCKPTQTPNPKPQTPNPMLSRRAFLSLGIASGAVVAGGGLV
jgi:hypothetical protein